MLHALSRGRARHGGFLILLAFSESSTGKPRGRGQVRQIPTEWVCLYLQSLESRRSNRGWPLSQGSVDQGLAYIATPDQPRIDPDRHFKSTKDSALAIILRNILQPVACLYNHFRLIKDWFLQPLQVNSRTGFHNHCRLMKNWFRQPLQVNKGLVSTATAC